MDPTAAQARIRELTKDGTVRAKDVDELRKLATEVYHPSALDDLILPLMKGIEDLNRTLSDWITE